MTGLSAFLLYLLGLFSGVIVMALVQIARLPRIPTVEEIEKRAEEKWHASER